MLPSVISRGKIGVLWAASLPVIVVTVALVLSALLAGCASAVSRGLLPEVVARRPPNIQLGKELILLQEPTRQSTILISKDGLVHVFAIDDGRQLNHIEILGDEVITHELLDAIERKSSQDIDAVEHPHGQLRVLAGEKQYVRPSPDLGWQEIMGNRCSRFVSVGDVIFCAFAANGEEVRAPQRTDVTVGFFILIPIAWWSHKYASKLVLAQETGDGWLIRAVLDADTQLDADRDFMMETDR